MYEFSLRPLIFFLVVLFFVFWIFGIVIRKLLGVERKKWFSYNHVNKMHKKLDWGVRIFFLIFLLVTNLYTITNNLIGTYWFVEPWFIVFILITVSESLRAFMEWKYVENKRDFIATIAELLFAICVILVVIKTDLFGLF